MVDQKKNNSRDDSVFDKNYVSSINGLEIAGVQIKEDLFEELSNGIQLLRILDTMKNGKVNWKQVNLNPKNKYQVGENCNQVITLSKKLGLEIIGIGSQEIQEKNKKLMRSLIWQILKYQIIDNLGLKNEADLIKWANNKVKSVNIKDFKDSKLRDGEFLKLLTGEVLKCDCGSTIEDALEQAKNKNMKVNLTGIDVQEGSQIPIFEYVGTLAQYEQSGDDELLKWANAQVESIQIENFRDQKLADAEYLKILSEKVFGQEVPYTSEGKTSPDTVAANTANIVKIAKEHQVDANLDGAQVANINDNVIRKYVKQLWEFSQSNDDDLIKWANDKVQVIEIQTFGDDKLKDAQYLSKLMEKVQEKKLPQVEDASNIAQIVQNLNEAGEKLGVTATITPEDIQNANKIPIKNYVQALKDASERKQNDELLRWANYKAKQVEIVSFKDPHLKDAEFLNSLVQNVGCEVLDNAELPVDYVQENKEDDEVILKNGQSLIDGSQKIGINPKLKPQDILDVNEEEIRQFAADLRALENDKLLKWANQNGGGDQIGSFQDDSLQNSKLLFALAEEVSLDSLPEQFNPENCEDQGVKEKNAENLINAFNYLDMDSAFTPDDVLEVDSNSIRKMVDELYKYQRVKTFELRNWANSRVVTMQIENFDDPIIKDGKYLSTLLQNVGKINMIGQLIDSNKDDTGLIDKIAQNVLKGAESLGCKQATTKDDILSGNKKPIKRMVAQVRSNQKDNEPVAKKDYEELADKYKAALEELEKLKNK